MGWKLDQESRDKLLALYPPRYPDVVADHVTLKAGVSEPVPEPVSAIVYGHVDDQAGVEALVVMIDGQRQRPDEKFYHITWSIDRAAGRKPAHSNDVLTEISPVLSDMIPITVTPHSKA